MFGFIRPVKPELRVRDAERFQQVYCGLCHAVRARYGRFHTLFLSYDMTFFALVVGSARKDTAPPCRKRCSAHPFRRRPCAQDEDGALALAADASVLLVWHKLEDSVRDEKGLRRLAYRLLRFLARRGYRRARTRLPEADEEMAAALHELQALECARCDSLDRPADASARLIAGIVPRTGDGRERVLRQMLYQTGRWLYLLDAAHDLADDWKTGNYNPLVFRYGLRSPDLTEIKEPLGRTLERSLADVCMAYDLLDVQRDAELIRNIIFLGMPVATRQVLDGAYQTNGGWGRHGSL